MWVSPIIIIMKAKNSHLTSFEVNGWRIVFTLITLADRTDDNYFERITWPVCTVGNFFRTDNLIRVHGSQIFSHGSCTDYARLFAWKRQIIRNVFAWEETFAINYFFLRCKFKYKRSFSRPTMRLTASYRSAALRRYAILCSIKIRFPFSCVSVL